LNIWRNEKYTTTRKQTEQGRRGPAVRMPAQPQQGGGFAHLAMIEADRYGKHPSDDLSHGISVVIPVYNSEGCLPQLIERLEPVLKSADRPVRGHYDQRWQAETAAWGIIHSLTEARGWLTGINMMRNYGQHNAILCGIRAARFDTIVTIDDDLQHPPEEIPIVLEALDEGCDVVYGTPADEAHGLWRDLASQDHEDGAPKHEWAPRRLAVSAHSERSELSFGMHSRTTEAPMYRSMSCSRGRPPAFGAVKVKHDQRTIGASNYSFKKLVTHALNMVTASALDLYRSPRSSVLCSCSSDSGARIRSWALYPVSRACSRLLFSGIRHLDLRRCAVVSCSGSSGSILARMHFRMMERPTYALREIARKRESSD